MLFFVVEIGLVSRIMNYREFMILLVGLSFVLFIFLLGRVNFVVILFIELNEFWFFLDMEVSFCMCFFFLLLFELFVYEFFMIM